MANRPANAGAHSAGPQHRGPADAPPPVHHQDNPRRRRAAAPRAAKPALRLVAWLPYLVVLAGAVIGLVVAAQGARHAGRGAAVVGTALLVAALARLVLPPRYAGLLVTRGKALDVAAFAVLGAAVLGAAATLP